MKKIKLKFSCRTCDFLSLRNNTSKLISQILFYYISTKNMVIYFMFIELKKIIRINTNYGCCIIKRIFDWNRKNKCFKYLKAKIPIRYSGYGSSTFIPSILRQDSDECILSKKKW